MKQKSLLKTLFLLLCALVAGSGSAWAEEVIFNFPSIAESNNWSNGVAYTSIVNNPITITAKGGGNNGKYYTSSGGSWRIYKGGSVEITASNGYTITAVTSNPEAEFTITNGVALFSPSTTTQFVSITVTYTTSGDGPGGTITLNAENLGLTTVSYTNTSKTIDGITYVYTDLMKNGDNIQAKASSGTIKNTTAFSGYISNVAITHSGTARATTINGSADGTNWTQVATGEGTFTADFSGKFYRYFQITRGSNAAYWTKIEIATVPAYSIAVTSNNENYGTVSLDGNVITANPNVGYKVGGFTVTSGTASVTDNNDNTFTVSASSDCTIQINFEVAQVHQVIFSVNGNNSDPVSYYEDAVIDFPANPANVNDMKFMGWYTEPYSNATTAPDFVTSAKMGDGDVTYYAVFANQTNATRWKIVALDAVTEGIYALLTNDYHAFNGRISSGHGQITTNAFEFSNDYASSAPEGTLEFTITAVTGGFAMYAENYGYLYASAAKSGSLDWHNEENSYWHISGANWLYKVGDSNAYLRSYSNTSFRTYSSSSNAPIHFAKKETVTSYSDYCTTVPEPAITLSTSSVEATAAETDGTINVTYTAIDFTNPPVIVWYTDATATSTTTVPTWLEAEINSDNNLDYTIEANTGAARTAYMKVLAIDVNGDNVYSELIVITQAAATVPVAVTSAGLATFACDNNLDYTNVSGLEAYIAKNGENGTIALLKKNKVPAGTGVLLRATDGGTSFNVPVASGDMDIVEDNLFVRGTGATVASEETVNSATKYNYILNVVDNKLGFYKANNKTVATNRAYLQTSVAAEARVDINFGENSGIVTVSREATASNRFYDLQGRSVMQPTKGLYIVNGKKVVVK